VPPTNDPETSDFVGAVEAWRFRCLHEKRRADAIRCISWRQRFNLALRPPLTSLAPCRRTNQHPSGRQRTSSNPICRSVAAAAISLGLSALMNTKGRAKARRNPTRD
jgi:hypothetical protein